MLFKKSVCFTDIHFGRSGNSSEANQDNLDFIDWMIDEAKTWGAETCIFLGDWNDSRSSTNVLTLDYSLKGMEKINNAFKTVYFLPGNHDLFYRDKRDITSVIYAKHLSNINLILNPLTIDNVTLLPWLVSEEHKSLKTLKSRYIFSHMEAGGGFLMNANVAMPDLPHGINEQSFPNQEHVFSGHFHLRQTKGNLTYIGNVMPFNFADSWDADRGAMFLEWGKDPFYKSWTHQPLFRTMTLSEMLENPNKYLAPRLTARVAIDIDISYEEAQVIKDMHIDSFGLRKIELVHAQKTEANQEFTEDIVFQSVDQIVISGLQSIESIGLSPERLVEIYKGLQI